MMRWRDTMNKKGMAALFAVLVVLAVTTFMPVSSRRRPNTVKIGVISSTTAGLDTLVPLYEEIIEPDINEYCSRLPTLRFVPQLRFEFVLSDAEGSADMHLQRVQEFHNEGVDMIIGGSWSSHAYASLDYVNENDMLLFSPSATYPGLAIPGDNLFRLCLDDNRQAPAIAEMLLSQGIQTIIVIQRGDVWGDGLFDALRDEYESKGGAVYDRIRYPEGETDFTSYMTDAENAAVGAVYQYGFEHVGVLLLSFDEAITIVGMAQDFTTLFDLIWFGAESRGSSTAMLEAVPDQACKLKLYSTYAAPDYSAKWNEMAHRYEDVVGQPLSFYMACNADISWIIAQAVLETRPSMSSHFSALDVIEVIPDVADRYYGYTGWCRLNEAGDRFTRDFDIWGYGYIDGEPSIKKYGFYDSTTGTVTWYQA